MTPFLLAVFATSFLALVVCLVHLFSGGLNAAGVWLFFTSFFGLTYSLASVVMQ